MCKKQAPNLAIGAQFVCFSVQPLVLGSRPMQPVGLVGQVIAWNIRKLLEATADLLKAHKHGCPKLAHRSRLWPNPWR